MLIDRNLPRYYNVEKEMEYKFKVFKQNDAKKYLKFIKKIVESSDFNEIEIIVKIKEP